jgi:hypothetical protein
MLSTNGGAVLMMQLVWGAGWGITSKILKTVTVAADPVADAMGSQGGEWWHSTCVSLCSHGQGVVLTRQHLCFFVLTQPGRDTFCRAARRDGTAWSVVGGCSAEIRCTEARTPKKQTHKQHCPLGSSCSLSEASHACDAVSGAHSIRSCITQRCSLQS